MLGLLILTTIVFLIFLGNSIIKRKWVASTLLFGVYAFSLLFGIVRCMSGNGYMGLSIFGTITFCFLIYLMIKPFCIRKPEFVFNQNDKHFNKRFTRVGYAIGGILSLGNFLILPIIVLVSATVGLDTIRNSMYNGEYVFADAVGRTEQIGMYIMWGLHYLSYTSLALFFFAITFVEGKKLMKFLLIWGSLLTIFQGMIVAGRTNMTYWLFFALFLTCVFSPYWKKGTKRFFVLFSSVLIVAFASYFLAVSGDRFEDYEGGTEGGLVEYIGQPFQNYCEFFDKFDYNHFTLRRLFPLTSTLFYGELDLGEYRYEIEQLTSSHMFIGVFYTLLGDLIVDIGRIGMIVYVLIYNFVAGKVTRKRKMTVSDFLPICLLYQIPLFGLFYYSFWRYQASAYFIITFLVAWYLKPNKRKYERS